MNKRKSIGFFFSVLAIVTASNAWALNKELPLDFGSLGQTKIQVIVPDAAIATGQALPVVFLVSGFQTSKQLAGAMSQSIGNNIVIAYEYPLDDKMNWLDWSNPADGKMAGLIPAIPLQIVAVLNWIRSPALMGQFGVSADTTRINVVAVSLGIFFTPMALRLAQLQGIYENSVVLAYAGAKLNAVVEEQARQAEGATLARLLDPIIRPSLLRLNPPTILVMFIRNIS